MVKKDKETELDPVLAMQEARGNLQVLLGCLLASSSEEIVKLAEQGVKDNIAVIIAKTKLIAK